MKKMIANLLADDTAASMTEYALLLALIAVATIGVLQILSGNIQAVFTRASSELEAAVPAS